LPAFFLHSRAEPDLKREEKKPAGGSRRRIEDDRASRFSPFGNTLRNLARG
jgi:hypothetical protein